MTDSHHPVELVNVDTLAPLVSLDSSRQRPGQGTATSLSRLFGIVQEQKWKLLGFIGIAMTAAIVLQFTLTPLYEATAEVKVDRHQTPGILGSEASQVSSVDDMDQVITTNVQLAQSDPVLRPVTEQYQLLQEERQLKGLTPAEMDRKRSSPIELKRLKVVRPPNTYLISISYRASSPRLASDVANGIATSLVERSNQTANRPYVEISSIIKSHLAALRTKMDASSRKLLQYEKDLSMVDPEQHTTILMARLEQLNTEFTTAQADRLHKEAILSEVVHAPSIAAARAAELDSQRSLLTDALQRIEVARQQFSAARSYYGENHPEYLRAKAQLDEAQEQVAAARSGTSDKANADYSQAINRERKLQAMVEQTKAEVNRQNQMVIEYEQLKNDFDLDKTTYNELEKHNAEADVNNHFRDATIQMVTPARAPYLPIFPKLIINLPVAFILSAILGILAIVLADALETTFSDPEDVASRLTIDVVASIPIVRQLPPLRTAGLSSLSGGKEGRSAEMTAIYGESIRILRNTISLTSMDKPIHTLLMTSAMPAEGKSTTSAHLALACAQVGKKVLLIDADMRRPTVHKQFGVSCDTGLSEMLLRGVPFADALIHIDNTGLYLLPAGPVSQQASDLVSIGFASLLAKVAKDFDLVIIDGTPALGFAETQEIAAMVDGVLLVVKAGSTTGKAVAESMAGMLRVRAHILGIVMNQVKSSATRYGYSYLSGKPASQKV